MPPLSNTNSNLFYANVATPNISMPTPLNYSANYGAGTKMGELLGKIGGTLAPMGQYTKSNPYEQLASPYRETLNSWEKTFARPEFEKFTANPWEKGYGNNLATSGASQMGSAQNRYQTAKNQVWQPYHNQVADAQSQMEEMIRKFYNNNLSQNYDSPTAFRA